MNERNNPKLKNLSQNLRKNMTKEERHLWYDFLKNLPVTVNRQKVIGKYIVDFYCAKANIIIELDGSQHFFNNRLKNDKIRDEYLKSLSIKVLRYSNSDVNKNFKGVYEGILQPIPK